MDPFDRVIVDGIRLDAAWFGFYRAIVALAKYFALRASFHHHDDALDTHQVHGTAN